MQESYLTTLLTAQELPKLILLVQGSGFNPAQVPVGSKNLKYLESILIIPIAWSEPFRTASWLGSKD